MSSAAETTAADRLRDEVRERYATAARAVTDGTSSGCCGSSSSCCGDAGAGSFGEALYTADQRDDLPDTAALASLGCGNPTAVGFPRSEEHTSELQSREK